jgi:hypothetical protein
LKEINYQIKRFFFALMLEPFTLSAWRAIFQERAAIVARRRALNIKINPLSLEKWRHRNK